VAVPRPEARRVCPEVVTLSIFYDQTDIITIANKKKKKNDGAGKYLVSFSLFSCLL
jgi:hypothetical protein